jgi:hypothetical protein
MSGSNLQIVRESRYSKNNYKTHSELWIVILAQSVHGPCLVTGEMEMDILPKARMSRAQDKTIAIEPEKKLIL